MAADALDRRHPHGVDTATADVSTSAPWNGISARLHWMGPFIGIIGVALAAYLIYRVLAKFGLDSIARSLRVLSWPHLGLAAAFTVASYVSLTGFDTLALRWAGGRLPYRKTAFVSIVSLSIGHTTGFAPFSTGGIRLRLYTTYGLSAGAVAQIVVFCAVTVLVGLCTVGGIGAVSRPRLAGHFLHLTGDTTTLLGVALLGVTAAYLTFVALVQQEFRIRGRTVRVPSFGLALGQVAIGTIDFLLVAAVLFQVLRAASVNLDYFTVASLYVAANAAAIVTHAPGGLGVIEAVVLSQTPQAEVVAALIAFRVIYYLVPFVIGCVLLGAFELWHYRGGSVDSGLGRSTRKAGWTADTTPSS